MMKSPLSTAQLARKLGKSVSTIQRMAARGEIPGAQKLDGRNGAFVFDPELVDAWLAGQAAGKAAGSLAS